MKKNVSHETFLQCCKTTPFFKENSFPNYFFDKIYLYYCEYMKWNKVHNISAVKTLEDFVEQHLADSLLPVRFFKNKFFSSVADFGSGAGFPGIPLSLFYKNSGFYLFDTVRKKTSFIKFFCYSNGVQNVTIHNENFFKASAFFDCVTMRAVNLSSKTLARIKKHQRNKGFLLYYASIKQDTSSFEHCISYAVPNISRNKVVYILDLSK